MRRTEVTNRGGKPPKAGHHDPPQSAENHTGSEGGEPALGPVESKVRQDVGALVSGHPMGEALAEMAFCLARTLDRGAGLAVAAVNRELRANLVELARLGVDGDDDLDDRLSTPVLDFPES